jgi:ubiquinol-cytochrome c reductase cytochrome b subunit
MADREGLDPGGAREEGERLSGVRIDPGEAEKLEPTELERVLGWFDRRTGLAGPIRGAMAKVFPDHWSFLLGEIALFCFVILVATGTFLTFFYTPDAREVTYDGSYATLHGTDLSAAFASVLRLSFDVEAGLLMRQVHHWTALIFIGAIAAHLARIFFTGAFRRPREINYLIGMGLLTFALGEGITGYSLPDDLLSGTGLRIIDSAMLSIPFVGPWVASLFFGGEFPTPDILSRLFVFHVMLLPGLLIGGITVHLALLWFQKHTQYRGHGAREDNVVGLSFWPGQVFRSLGLFFLTSAVVVLVAGLIQINPVWLYGPYVPYVATVPAQPDWYVGWLEGALRLGLPIEPTILGVTIPSPFVPGILIPGVIMTALALWPFIEARLTGDHREHNLLDPPWRTPIRTATGAAGVALFLVLTIAGGNDVLAVIFDVPVEAITMVFRVLLIVAPVVTWLIVYRMARDLRNEHERREREGAEEEPPSVILARNAAGGFSEVKVE